MIAVVDSGVDAGHPDLQAKLLPGRRFYNGGSWDSNWQDYNGHGTHVAGIAAASTNNGQGVAGVGWNNRILPVRVLDSTGSGYTSDVAAGVRWAVDNGARVINMSLGGEGYDPALETATSYAWSHGSLVVAAAGNCGDPQNYYPSCSVANPVIFPAANPNVLAVAATDSADGRPSFSSYGWWVDVAAPGVSVLSTMWSGNYLTPGCSGQAYCYLSGTSMASPAVAGLAALVWARDPAQSPAQVANTIMNTALDLGPQGWDQEYGYGRINAAAAIYAMPSAAAPQTQPMVAQAPAQHAAPRAGAAAQPGIVLVRFRQGVAAAPGLARHKLAADGEIEGLRIIKVKVPAGKEYETAVELLADPDVEFAQPDYVVKAM
jgi:subtilisin family serine protease